ncbi:MAG: hypothetical protein IJA61_03000 [Clostridia bacterium]|nr:hypothetical protein [Clostridia bacterium]
MTEEKMIYLVRACGERSARMIERFISGDEMKGENITGENHETFLSSENDTMDKLTATEKVLRDGFIKEVEDSACYFYYGSGLGEIRESLFKLLQQPASEQGVVSDWQNPIDVNDFVAGSKVSLLISKIPEDKFDEFVRIGKAQVKTGEYETKEGKSLISEVALGERATREVLNPESVVVYDEIHKVMNNGNIFEISNEPYDWSGKYSSSYVPSVIVDKTKIAEIEKTGTSIREKQLSEAEAWLKSMEESGMSAEELALIKSAFRETKAHSNDDVSTNNDVPTDDFDM